MDANQILTDVELSALSIMWFPNHFLTLPPLQAFVLKKFDIVASLAPTATAMLSDKKYNLKKVVTIPHIIEIPSDLNLNKSLAFLRKKYNIPEGAFVVYVNCGNYEKHNRKSFDTILFAFKQFLEVVPEAFLYLKAIASREIFESEGFAKHLKIDDTGACFE